MVMSSKKYKSSLEIKYALLYNLCYITDVLFKNVRKLMKKLILLLLALTAPLLSAEELKIFVVDKDLDIPLEGAKIVLESAPEIMEISDEDGKAELSIPDTIHSGTVRATFPGYKEVSVNFSETSETLVISMSIADVIEGEALVVNRKTPEKTEEKPGVATVVSKEQMHTTAAVGLAEDCMAAVRTLPGVSYSGAWGSEPSIRGGDPRETSCLLDGMYTIFPWHWGGGFSIFNPSIVDSIKLSNGVFSAKYGRASAGILEATTLTPDYEKFHLNAGLSTTCADAFAQIPFGKDKGGMLVGAHLSYLDPFIKLYQQCASDLDMIERAPYIRDIFAKANFTPFPELLISLVGFFGSDGLKIDQTEDDDGLKTRAIMDYDIYQALGGVNIKYLFSDKMFFHGVLSYNGMFEDMSQKVKESGTIKYTDEFVRQYSSVYPEVKEGGFYVISDLESEYAEEVKSHLFTGRFETELELSEKNHLCAGIEESFATSKTTELSNAWNDIETGGKRLFRKTKFSTESDGNCILDSALFASWTFGNENDFFQSELGIRGEFINIWNISDDYNMNFLPDFCPRASVTFTPFRDMGKIDKVSFSAGTGLFVSIPRETMLLTKDMGLDNFNEHPNRALFVVLGSSLALSGGWNFKLETYYKYYLSRIFAYSETDAKSDYQDAKIFAKTDGQGHIFGIDSMIEKKAGGMWDGYLSYSFTFTKFKNSATINPDAYSDSTIFGEPINEWYYPNYHRFHTLNLVSNLHFGTGWTFTVKGTIASGTPMRDEGSLACYAAKAEDGTIIQRYTKSYFYSDTLRTDISCPIDLRLSKKWKSHGGKAEWEFYIAVQDVFVNLYSPKKYELFNKYTGKKSDIKESADSNIGIPIPSLGLKIKF